MAYNSYKNECLINALQQVAKLVGDKKAVGEHKVGLGLSLQNDY